MAFSRGSTPDGFTAPITSSSSMAASARSAASSWARCRGSRASASVLAGSPAKTGDGRCFDAGHPEQEEEGGRVYEVRSPKSKVQSPTAEGRTSQLAELHFGWGDIDFKAHSYGRQDLEDERPRTGPAPRPELRRGHAAIPASGPDGKRMAWQASRSPSSRATNLATWFNSTQRCRSPEPKKQPLTTARLREQLGRLGARRSNWAS